MKSSMPSKTSILVHIAAALASAMSAQAQDAKAPAAASAEPSATTTKQSVPTPAAGEKTPTGARRRANDRLDLDPTAVTGNRELPKVLYIVPWKKSDLGELPGQPFNTLLDEALTPVDRDVFRREVTYYGAVVGATQRADAAPQNETAPAKTQ